MPLPEFTSNAMASRQTPVPRTVARVVLFPAGFSKRKLIPNTYLFHWGLRRKMKFWFILWSLVTSGF